MKSIAAYYVLVAMNGEQQHAQSRRAAPAPAQPKGPSLLSRVRDLVVAARSTGTAPTAA